MLAIIENLIRPISSLFLKNSWKMLNRYFWVNCGTEKMAEQRQHDAGGQFIKQE